MNQKCLVYLMMSLMTCEKPVSSKILIRLMFCKKQIDFLSLNKRFLCETMLFWMIHCTIFLQYIMSNQIHIVQDILTDR